MKSEVNIDGKCSKCAWGCNSNAIGDFTLKFGLIIQKKLLQKHKYTHSRQKFKKNWFVDN